jgi:integrase
VLEVGRALGYRKSSKGGGTWIARLYRPDAKPAKRYAALGAADDFHDADGIDILSFAQAQAKAQVWFSEELDRFAETEGLVVSSSRKKYMVGNALDDYLKDAERRGVKGIKIMTTTINAHIRPALGDIEVKKLTRHRIETWLHELAESPRRMTGKVRDEVKHLADPSTDDERRARKDTANRVLTNLKSALNYALTTHRYRGPANWREVKKYEGVERARVRFLSVQEQRRLVNACPDGFKQLVQAALYTGCRYGELCRLKIRDFNPTAGSIFIEQSKSGKTRQIFLDEEGKAWFKEQVAGRNGWESILVKPNAKGKGRKYQEDPLGWGPHDQKKLMVDACEKAKIEALGFHELRHTYASGLLDAEIAIKIIAIQLGHADTTMVEKYYAHLGPNAVADAIRKKGPKLKISKSKIKPLEITKSVG